MHLYLMRHGEATDKNSDPQRPLTAEGRQAVAKVAGFFKNYFRIPTAWHSSKLRAKQTAEIFKDCRVVQLLKEKEDIQPLDPPGELAVELSYRDEDLLIVGHLPFLQKLVSLLLTRSEQYEMIDFKAGGIVCLERNNHWYITCIIYPNLL